MFGKLVFLHNKGVKDKSAAECTHEGTTVYNLKNCPFEHMMGLRKKAKGKRQKMSSKKQLAKEER